MAGDEARVVYPYFFSDARGRFLPLVEIESAILGRRHRLRIYLPPGYEENTLAHYPFAYMQDGQNLFFLKEAFQQKEWEWRRQARCSAPCKPSKTSSSSAFTQMSGVKRNIPSRATKLMRARSSEELVPAETTVSAHDQEPSRSHDVGFIVRRRSIFL